MPGTSALSGGRAINAPRTFSEGPGSWREPLRRARGHALRDHSAHRGTTHVSLRDAERVEHADRVVGHVGQAVGALHRQAERVAQGAEHEVGHALGVEALAQPDVAVVEAHDPKAALDESIHEALVPAEQLHAEAHDEQQRFAAGGPAFLDLDGNAVGRDLHAALSRQPR